MKKIFTALMSILIMTGFVIGISAKPEVPAGENPVYLSDVFDTACVYWRVLNGEMGVTPTKTPHCT